MKKIFEHLSIWVFVYLSIWVFELLMLRTEGMFENCVVLDDIEGDGPPGDADQDDNDDAGGCCCGEADLSLSSSIQPQLRITRSSPLTGNKNIISFLSKKINSFWFCFSGTLEEKGQFVTWKKSTFSAVIWDFLRRCLNIYH